MNKFKFDAFDGDLLIQSNNNHSFRCHSKILENSCHYFKSRKQYGSSNNILFFDFSSLIIKYVMKILYREGNKQKITKHDDYINVILFMDELQINDEFNIYQTECFDCLVNIIYENWIEVLELCYKYFPLEKLKQKILLEFEEDLECNKFKIINFDELTNQNLKDDLMKSFFKKYNNLQIQNKELCKRLENYNKSDQQLSEDIVNNNNIINKLIFYAKNKILVTVGFYQIKEIFHHQFEINYLIDKLKIIY